MTAVVLPRILADVVGGGPVHEVDGETVEGALASLFDRRPALRSHLVDESGAVRPHVLLFVDGEQAGLDQAVGAGSEIQIIQSVSGG